MNTPNQRRRSYSLSFFIFFFKSQILLLLLPYFHLAKFHKIILFLRDLWSIIFLQQIISDKLLLILIWIYNWIFFFFYP